MANQTFFQEIQGAAVLKHGILGRYLVGWASKVGSRSKDNLLYYLDGYAGPGTYTDGAPGSPALAVSTAQKLAHIREFRGICVEHRAAEYRQLEQMLAPHDNWTAVEGRIERCLPDLLKEIDDAPLFAFFDPFGVALPFDQVVEVMKRSGRSSQVKTELLLNFSLPGLRRHCGGHLDSSLDYPSKATFLRKADAWLGGEWWRAVWRDGGPTREQDIALEYLNRLRDAAGGGWGWYATDVSDTWTGPPSYWLLFLSKHYDGHWLFNQNLSSARDNEYREFCGMATQRDLFSDGGVWVEVITENIERLASRDGSFVPRENMGELYGTVLGYARETHVRQALNQLHEQGLIEPNPVGQKVPTMTVRWAGA